MHLNRNAGHRLSSEDGWFRFAELLHETGRATTRTTTTNVSLLNQRTKFIPQGLLGAPFYGTFALSSSVMLRLQVNEGGRIIQALFLGTWGPLGNAN